MISAIIVTGCFIGLLLIIFTEKLNRAIASLGMALITFFTLTVFENANISVFIELLFGSTKDGFVNLRSLILIMGMQFIVQVCNEGGVFHFLGFKLVQITSGRPIYLLLVLCIIAVLITSVLSLILAALILIPLTITISRILDINPSPYIVAEGVIAHTGSIFFSISSVPDILITNSFGITFAEYFLNIGLMAIIIFAITLFYYSLIHRKKLSIPQENLPVLREFNAWNFVQNQHLFYNSIFILIAVMDFLAIIPPEVVSPDVIALTGGIILVLISKLNARDLISKIDFELLLYLMGIFIITGAMGRVGVINIIGNSFSALSGGDPLITVLAILWVAALLTGPIESIPVTKVLIPVAGIMTTNLSPAQAKVAYYGLTFGANLGDNLLPMGDTMVVVNLAEKNERPINFKELGILGFKTAILQLAIVTIYCIIRINILIGLLVLSFILLTVFLILLYRYIKKKYGDKITLKLSKLLNKIKKGFSKLFNTSRKGFSKFFNTIKGNFSKNNEENEET